MSANRLGRSSCGANIWTVLCAVLVHAVQPSSFTDPIIARGNVLYSGFAGSVNVAAAPVVPGSQEPYPAFAERENRCSISTKRKLCSVSCQKFYLHCRPKSFIFTVYFHYAFLIAFCIVKCFSCRNFIAHFQWCCKDHTAT